MSLTGGHLDALLAAGVTAEQIVALVKVDLEERAKAEAERRAKDAERTALYRARGGGKIPHELRVAIFERDRFACIECGSDERLECDHVHPVSRGGETTLDNLQTLCRSCNARKKDRVRKAEGRGHSKEIRGQGGQSEDTPSPLTPPLKTPPDPQKYTPPISPQPEDLSAEPTAATPLTKKEILEAWHQRMVPLGFPAVRKMTALRDRQLSARLKDSTLEDWQRAMDALERSSFCRGENDRGWRADFDFLLQPKSFTKLIEGAYDH